MNIVYFFGGRGNTHTPQGSVIRGIRLMDGLIEAGHNVIILFEGSPSKTVNGNLTIIETKNRIEELKKIVKLGQVDRIYVRGHPFMKKIREVAPNVHICLELYLNPYFEDKMNVDFQAYQFLDSFVVIGKLYHSFTLDLLKNKFKVKIKPNTYIYPSCEYDKEKNKQERIYSGCIFDGINQNHHTLTAAQGLNQYCANTHTKGIFGTGFIKDKQMYSKITALPGFPKNIIQVAPNYHNIHEYYRKSKSSICLYTQPKIKAVNTKGKIYKDFLVSLRLIESLCYGCIPIVSPTLANQEILGDYVKTFSIGGHSAEWITHQLNVINHNDGKEFKHILDQINIEQFSNKYQGKRLSDFLQ